MEGEFTPTSEGATDDFSHFIKNTGSSTLRDAYLLILVQPIEKIIGDRCNVPLLEATEGMLRGFGERNE
jgi:hypothetical protein